MNILVELAYVSYFQTQMVHRQRMAHYERELPYDEGARIITNDRSKSYIRGAFLGRGTTSSCVLLMEEDTRRCIAGKMFNVEEMQLLYPRRIRRVTLIIALAVL